MNNEEYREIIENIEKEDSYEIIEGILYRKKNEKKLQVIRRFELEGIMYMMHDHPTAGHFGINATYERIKERFYWNKMKDDVERYVKSCDQCQRRGKPRNKNELHSIKVIEPFYQIGIDYVSHISTGDN
jgi:hypothetical protein